MALHTDTEIYKSTYDLSKLVTQLVANMPRNFKADFGAELRRRCMTLVMRTYEANTNADKAAILQRMRMEIETVNLSLRLAVDLRLISVNQYSRAIAITDSIGSKPPAGRSTRNARKLPACQGRPAKAPWNLVEPLGHKPTERCIRNISRSICSDSAQFAC